MELELRLAAGAATGSLVAQALKMGADCISVGDEGCPHRLPAPEGLARALADIARGGARPRLVTPRVAHAELPAVMALVGEAARAGADIVVNDLGVLYACRGALARGGAGAGAAGSRLYLGRLVARSVADCPWYDLALRRESPQARDGIVRHSFEHGPKLALLKRLGVAGIEVNNAPAVAPSLARVAAGGLAVRVHVGRRLLTAGRNCATARHLGLAQPDCAAGCGEEYQLEWEGAWHAPTAASVAVGEEGRRRLRGAVVVGNRVLAPESGGLDGALAAGAAAVIVEVARARGLPWARAVLADMRRNLPG